MKVINRMIRRTIIEIVVIVALVFISVPVWQSFDLSEYASVAMYYDNMGANYLEVSDYSDYKLYQINDLEALDNIKPINLRVSNNTNTVEDYAVWMVVSKSSTLDYKTLKINIDNETKNITELEMLEDESNYYFLLFEGNLSANAISKDVRLWLDIETVEPIANKYLEFDFENIQRQIL